MTYQAVGSLVDGAIAAEGNHHVIALVRGLAAELGGVPGRLRIDRIHLVAGLQCVQDQVAQTV